MEDKKFHRVHPKTLKRARKLRLVQTQIEKMLWRELGNRAWRV
jgi:very-short-patch-repair endonuclease